ncbi:MAG TPA: DUF3443 domain-containing protein [Casimicrobiaceae bacterium]|nr:DUF3443 domain-containing protein [Casimicrobiaceae bacterium]
MTGARLQALVALAALAIVLCLGGCGGGGGGSGGGSSSGGPTQNTQSIVVDGGPADVPNLAFTSVTICAPGSSSNCQTIDHVQVDTGSSGLRIIASALSSTLSLPQQTDGSGNPLVECAQFTDGFSWGPVTLADIHIAGEQASSVPVQIIGDSNFAAIPRSCSSSGPPENTVATFGANGVLGVGLFAQDCGPGCAQAAIPGAYYSCSGNVCQPVIVALPQQLQNPVTLFSADNNGVIIQLPSVPAAGAATATGSMIFGIGTQADNALGSATVLTTDPETGTISTIFESQTYTNSYIDSGSSVVFFGVDSFPACSNFAEGFYCPATTQNLSATLQGATQGTAGASLSVANADQLFAANPSFNAFNDVAGPAGDTSTFAWGLPLFYGRTVYTAIEKRATPAGPGPYFAF